MWFSTKPTWGDSDFEGPRPAAIRVSLLPILHYRYDLAWWAVPSLCLEGTLNVVCVCLPAMCQSFKNRKQTASRLSRQITNSGPPSQTSLRPKDIELGLITTESNVSKPLRRMSWHSLDCYDHRSNSRVNWLTTG
nr:uncharacterized protein CTRU02_05459 [Colletotrichum truncatum]KAF6793902.1 hypothetical protein CTRU02_05459 [Colletotrichum truncatum]